MKRKIQIQLAALAQRTRRLTAGTGAALRWAMLAPAVILTTSPAFATLPNVTAPTDGIDGSTCGDGDIMCIIGAYFKHAIGIIAVVVAALFLIYFGFGAFSKWKAYSANRADASDLKEFLIYGALMSAVVVLLAYLATQYAGITASS